MSERFWVPHPEHGYVAATFSKKIEGGKNAGSEYIPIEDNDDPILVPEAQVDSLAIVTNEQLQGVDNITELSAISEGGLLATTKFRFESDKIYTGVDRIVLACNPFKLLPIYTAEFVTQYSKGVLRDPHVYGIGSDAFRGLSMTKTPQAVLISGESGAGKTESTKHVLSYLADVAGNPELAIENKILSANPILEAFGNAKTVRNNNSSRFGKWIQLVFSPKMEIQGAQITDYLLELTRIVIQGKLERNYHIFYQIIAAENLKKQYELRDPSDYNYLKFSMAQAPKGINDKVDFQDTHTAFETIGFPQETMGEIYRIVAGILTLGNVEYKADNSGEGSEISNMEEFKRAAVLLGVDGPKRQEALANSVTKKALKIGKDITMKNLTPEKAAGARDAAGKLIYLELFKDLIYFMNQHLVVNDDVKVEQNYIGVLDIAGFESFEVNSLEQLFINLSNETLQFYFNDYVFKKELDVYKEEGISIEGISYRDNADILDLIQGKGNILDMLDEETQLNKATYETYGSKVNKKYEKHDRFIKNRFNKPLFTIKHFAGDVEYTLIGWLEKNIDDPPKDLVDIMIDSTLPKMQQLGKKIQAALDGQKGKKPPMSKQFRASLKKLIDEVSSCSPHFIRCIKPNAAKEPKKFEGKSVMEQLLNSGAMECVKIRQSGYPFRSTFADFAARFFVVIPMKMRYVILKDAGNSNPSAKDITRGSMIQKISTRDGLQAFVKKLPTICGNKDSVQDKDFRMGKSKLFVKLEASNALQHQLSLAQVAYATMISKHVRGLIARKKVSNVLYLQKTSKDFMRSVDGVYLFKFANTPEGNDPKNTTPGISALEHPALGNGDLTALKEMKNHMLVQVDALLACSPMIPKCTSVLQDLTTHIEKEIALHDYMVGEVYAKSENFVEIEKQISQIEKNTFCVTCGAEYLKLLNARKDLVVKQTPVLAALDKIAQGHDDLAALNSLWDMVKQLPGWNLMRITDPDWWLRPEMAKAIEKVKNKIDDAKKERRSSARGSGKASIRGSLGAPPVGSVAVNMFSFADAGKGGAMSFAPQVMGSAVFDYEGLGQGEALPGNFAENMKKQSHDNYLRNLQRKKNTAKIPMIPAFDVPAVAPPPEDGAEDPGAAPAANAKPAEMGEAEIQTYLAAMKHATDNFDLLNLQLGIQHGISRGLSIEQLKPCIEQMNLLNDVTHVQKMLTDVAEELGKAGKKASKKTATEEDENERMALMGKMLNLIAVAKQIHVPEDSLRAAQKSLTTASANSNRGADGSNKFEKFIQKIDDMSDADRIALHTFGNLYNYEKLRLRTPILDPKTGRDIFLDHTTQKIRQTLTNDIPKKHEELCLDTFTDILGWMNDRPIQDAKRVALAYQIVQNAKNNVDCRNEIYVQILKQLRKNPSPKSEVLGWKLMLLLCQEALPKADLLDFVIAFFKISNDIDKDDEERVDFAKQALECIGALEKMMEGLSKDEMIDLGYLAPAASTTESFADEFIKSTLTSGMGSKLEVLDHVKKKRKDDKSSHRSPKESSSDSDRERRRERDRKYGDTYGPKSAKYLAEKSRNQEKEDRAQKNIKLEVFCMDNVSRRVSGKRRTALCELSQKVADIVGLHERHVTMFGFFQLIDAVIEKRKKIPDSLTVGELIEKWVKLYKKEKKVSRLLWRRVYFTPNEVIPAYDKALADFTFRQCYFEYLRYPIGHDLNDAKIKTKIFQCACSIIAVDIETLRPFLKNKKTLISILERILPCVYMVMLAKKHGPIQDEDRPPEMKQLEDVIKHNCKNAGKVDFDEMDPKSGLKYPKSISSSSTSTGLKIFTPNPSSMIIVPPLVSERYFKGLQMCNSTTLDKILKAEQQAADDKNIIERKAMIERDFGAETKALKKHQSNGQTSALLNIANSSIHKDTLIPKVYPATANVKDGSKAPPNHKEVIPPPPFVTGDHSNMPSYEEIASEILFLYQSVHEPMDDQPLLNKISIAFESFRALRHFGTMFYPMKEIEKTQLQDVNNEIFKDVLDPKADEREEIPLANVDPYSKICNRTYWICIDLEGITFIAKSHSSEDSKEKENKENDTFFEKSYLWMSGANQSVSKWGAKDHVVATTLKEGISHTCALFVTRSALDIAYCMFMISKAREDMKKAKKR